MQVTQTLAEGLKRQFKVVVTAADLAARYDTEVNSLRGRVNLNGFRPGKVPAAHLKRVYGKSIMSDVLRNVLEEANKKVVDDNELKLAAAPKVDITEDQALIERILDCKADLDIAIALEVLPNVELKDHSAITLVRPVAEVTKEEVDDAVQRMASASRPFEPRGDKDKAQSGDRLTIDFVGTIDGVAFDGGTANDATLVLGSGQFIPGFEDQLIGAKKGDKKTVNVTFPADYGAEQLAGKAAEFAVKVKAVSAPGELKIDDELAKKLGVESLDKMREVIDLSLGEELREQSRQKVKRQLLDALDGLYSFELPPTMVEEEFASIWRQLTADMQRAGESFAAGEEDTRREEYKKIAARRVRLGLVLSEIGAKAQIKLEDSEVTQALVQRARQFPGQEKQFFEFYRKNPEAIAEIRAPLFEEKVVDYLIGTLSVSDKKVTREELMADDDELAAAPAEKAEKPKKAKKADKDSAKKGEDKAE